MRGRPGSGGVLTLPRKGGSIPLKWSSVPPESALSTRRCVPRKFESEQDYPEEKAHILELQSSSRESVLAKPSAEGRECVLAKPSADAT